MLSLRLMDADDYFDDDDLVIDDNVIAALDWAESQFREAQRLTQQPVVGERRPADTLPPVELPPPKRQKTSHEWGGEPSALPVAEDDEELPDISIIGGGSYRLPAAQREAAHALAAQIRGPANDTNNEASRAPSAPVRDAVPPPAVVRNVPGRRASGSSSAAVNPPEPAVTPVAGPSSAVRTGNLINTAAKPRRSSTLKSIQEALAGLDTAQAAPGANIARPAPPAASSRVPRNAAPPRHSISPALPSSQTRPSVPPAAVAPSHSSRPVAVPASTVAPAYRRQSVPGPSRQHGVQPNFVQPRPPPPQAPRPSQGQSDRSIRIELDALRAQLEDLLKAQEETTKALQEAQNARYAKEGEVSILRKNMEKTAKEHAAEVARIKAAREQAEAAQAQLRKEMAEERERLRTQYMFKQHELETSLRKTPWSVRIKRTDNQGPLTPVSSSTQRRQAAVNAQNGGPSSIFQTPSRPRYEKSLPNSPERQHRKKIVDSPPPKKPAKLPGFYNAFEPSPLKASLHFSQASQSTQVKGKGKQRMEEPSFDFQDPPAEDLFFNPRPTVDDAQARSSPPSSPLGEETEDVPIHDPRAQKASSGPSSSAEPVTSSPVEDVEMKDESKLAEHLEPVEPLQVPDWTKELHRIVLTHKYRDSKQPTLQLLMNFTFTSSAPPESAREYSMQSARLLESLGSAAYKPVDADDVILAVQQTLSTMGRILSNAGSVTPLAELLDLMKVVALFVPAFVPLALAPADVPDSIHEPPEILLLVCETVSAHLQPGDEGLNEGHSALATAVLGLLEIICWYTPPDLAMRLSVILRKPGVLSTLVNSAQPTWLLLRTMRALTLAASYHSLWKHFLSFPLVEAPGDNSAPKDFTKIPQIEQLAALLIDRTRDGPEVRGPRSETCEPGLDTMPQCRPLREAILNLITTLAVAHTDALSILLQSHTLLPSIISFLNNITAPLWEEDEEFMRDADLITWTVQITTCTVLLLHHLMTNADSSKINLRQKLMFPPRRFANALWHMFTVSLGRISYAFPPDWAGVENAQRLDQICDLAKDVLEVAVDGPELESIWAAFQVDDNVPATSSRAQYDDDENEPRGAAHSAIEIE
ncbi:hypothetical protein BV20DRAFT_1012994 [Pilatotrama ljubarskyi]|nr:hypothetical protein BV20DRAFT_1012994 [Pilatotrama ljubarskyi]